MRIVQILPQLGFGGVERGTIDLARALKAKGHDVRVISAGGEFVKDLVRGGIPHWTLPVHRKSFFSLALIKTIRDYCHREKIDLLHARSRVPAWLAYLATRGSETAFVTTCHGYYSTHFLSRVMGWGKEVIVISKVIGRHMIEDFCVPPEKIHLIYRGVDLGRFPFDREKYDRPKSPESPFVISVVGRLSPIKGQLDFLKAFARLIREIPRSEAWMVGGPEKGKEKYFDELKLLTNRLGLERVVKWMGPRRDIPEVLGNSDLVVLPTRVPEGFGRVLIEAGARGTAVVATQVGGVNEVIENGKTGILIPPQDVEALTEAMIRIGRDRSLRKELSGRFRERVERDFSLTEMVEKTFEVYERAASRRRILCFKVGALGDLVLATPSFRMMKRRWPNAHLTVMVDPRWRGILENSREVDEWIPFSRDPVRSSLGQFLKIARRIREKGFDFSMDLSNNPKTHLLAVLGGIPLRYGFRRGPLGWLLNRGVEGFHRPLAPVRHQFQVLARAGVSDYEDRLEIPIDEKLERKIRSLLEDHWVNPRQKLIGFALSASARWKTKNWPAEHFLELKRLLEERLNARIVLLGEEKERELAPLFFQNGASAVIDLTGKTSLLELAALIRELDFLVVSDSAPLHIATAVGVPSVALFGPTDPKRHAPESPLVSVLKKELSCSPCYSPRCKMPVFACLPGIQPQEVFGVIEERFRRQERKVEREESKVVEAVV